jgi:hypothetical protein
LTSKTPFYSLDWRKMSIIIDGSEKPLSNFEILKEMPIVTTEQLMTFRSYALEIAKRHDELLLTVPELPPKAKK